MLITLGVIGVVAAITIPGLIQNHQANKLRSQFLKAYSEVSQALKMMKYDEISLDPTSYSRENKFINVFSSYFKVAHLCGDNSAINEARNKTLCYYNGDTSYKTLDGKRTPDWGRFDDGQFVLLDGALVMIENPFTLANQQPIWITIDINGKNAKPNRLGYDVFTFVVADTEEIVPMGSKGTRYTDMNTGCNPNVSIYYNGFACAYKALNQTDYFKQVVKTVKIK